MSQKRKLTGTDLGLALFDAIFGNGEMLSDKEFKESLKELSEEVFGKDTEVTVNGEKVDWSSDSSKAKDFQTEQGRVASMLNEMTGGHTDPVGAKGPSGMPNEYGDEEPSLACKIRGLQKKTYTENKAAEQEAYLTYLVDFINELIEAKDYSFLTADPNAEGAGISVILVEETPNTETCVDVCRELQVAGGWSSVKFSQFRTKETDVTKFILYY